MYILTINHTLKKASVYRIVSDCIHLSSPTRTVEFFTILNKCIERRFTIILTKYIMQKNMERRIRKKIIKHKINHIYIFKLL